MAGKKMDKSPKSSFLKKSEKDYFSEEKVGPGWPAAAAAAAGTAAAARAAAAGAAKAAKADLIKKNCQAEKQIGKDNIFQKEIVSRKKVPFKLSSVELEFWFLRLSLAHLDDYLPWLDGSVC